VSLAGISVDPIENNRAMVDKLLLSFPLLSDPEGRVIKRWDVWNEPAASGPRPDLPMTPLATSTWPSAIARPRSPRSVCSAIAGEIARTPAQS